MSQSDAQNVKKHSGACHCGRVKFEVELDLANGGSRCNCTICAKLGATGSMVKPPAFRLVAGEGALSTYTWGAGISNRFFCRHCGVYCFGKGHLAELGGDFVSVNLNALEGVELVGLKVVHWDGRHDNWEAGPRETPWPIFRDGAAAASASHGA